MNIDEIKKLIEEGEEAKATGRCPQCKQLVDKRALRDDMSREAFEAVGFCQSCQDEAWEVATQRTRQPTEEELTEMRMKLQAEINAAQLERPALEERYGQVWDTQELQRDFEVHGFLAPFCAVTKRSTKAKGSILFQHYPRYYWGFQPDP